MKYMNLLLVFLLVGMLGCSETGLVGAELEGETAKQDAVASAKRALWGTTYADFNLGIFADPTKPSWVGTLTIDDMEYGLVFYSRWAEYRGKAFHFTERVEVYTWANFDFVTQTLTTGDLLMWGLDKGVEPPNDHFQARGIVEEAFGEFAMWEGRHFHLVGTVAFHPHGFPLSAEGTMRLN